MKKKQNKRLSIDKIAHIYNGRSRSCKKCILYKEQKFILPITKVQSICVCNICRKSFVEGFKKGYKLYSKLKQNENNIS